MPSIDMERFREDINRYRFETDTTWTALAEKAGVSPAMFTRLKKGSIVTLEAFAQLCASCRLNPIDYMPELQTAQEHETAKERPMEETKRLSIDGKEFTIRDVDIRSGSAWANGPRISDAELPDGRVLGSIMPWHGEWLWRLAGEDWQRTKPAEGPMAAYTGQGPNRLSAIDNLLQAIEDRYSDTNTDPWVFMTDSASTTPDTVGQTTPEPVGDPWSLIPSDDAGLPMPNPGIDRAPTSRRIPESAYERTSHERRRDLGKQDNESRDGSRETKEGGKATTGLGRPVEAANVPEPMGARVRRRQSAGRTVHGKQQKTETTLRHAPRPQPGVVRGRGRPAAVRAGNHAMNTKGNAHDEQ